MKEHKSRISSSLFVISLMLAACAPVAAQQTPDGLGAFKTPVGAKITSTIMDRIAQRNRERKPASRGSGTSSTTRTSSDSIAKMSETSVRFRPTGTQLKTREIANLISPGNPQVLTILTTILQEFDKAASAAGHPNDLALALSFFLATNASVFHDAGQPTDPQMVELRNMIAEVLFTGFALAVYEEGKQGNNAETIKTSQQLAGQNLQAVTGISPDKINFTSQGLNIDNGSAVANDSSSTPNSSSAQVSATQRDPFPDRLGYAPQKPLSGTLKDSITMDDLVGKWDHGAGSVQRYVDSSTGNYAGTATSFYGEQYVIRSNGTFEYKFVGRANNNTVRETDRGTIILSGGYITFKFEGRTTKKYQFIAFNIQPTGAAILSLVEVHDTFQGYDAAGLALECGHPEGFIGCVGGEEWARIPVQNR